METVTFRSNTSHTAAPSRWMHTVRRWMHEAQSHPSEPKLARVIQLYDYDLIYIYHHLSEGTEVALRTLKDPATQQWRMGVFFRHYQLGWLTGIDQETTDHLNRNEEGGRAYIHSIRRQKYLPPQQLSVAIFKKKSTPKSDRK
ncbi:MAG: hypothetical protein ACFB10_02990 [Salibacteraceae bacterium]